MLLEADRLFGVGDKLQDAKSFWDNIYETVVSPDVIRPLIVVFIIGMVGVCRKLLKGQKEARINEENARLKLINDVSKASQASQGIEVAVTFFGQELQSTKQQMLDQFREQREYREEVRDQLQDINMKLRSVDKELHPNGGSSMKDSLLRVENAVGRYHDKSELIEEKLDDHIEQANYQIKRLDDLSANQKGGN